ncbi:MAG: chloride channel protein [Candidatus Binatia bacterium]
MRIRQFFTLKAEPQPLTPDPRPSTRRRFREQLDRVQPFSLVLLACAVGVVTGGGAIVFAELINLVQWLAIGSTELPLYVLPHLSWYHILVIPALGGLCVAFLFFFVSHEARGHGVPEVIESIAFKGGKIRPQVALIKSLASALTIGTGGSVGREGPIVQIGAALGSSLGQVLRVPSSRLPTLAGCGVAGGIAAVFNAPIAGAFFALEVVMGNFAMPAFGPIMLSSVLATVVSRAYFGNQPAFVVPGYTLVSEWELPFYLLLGIACGLGGLAFMFVLDTLEKGFAKLPIHNLLKPALGGLALGAIILFVPNIYGVGYATMSAILRGGIPWPWLLLLLPVKMGATSLTLASGGSGGLFLPILYLGAITGGLFGFGLGALFPTITAPSGAYALVGMAAFLAGAVHCPITAFLLLFEITGDYHIILPLMLSCTVSTLVAKLLREESIYTLQLLRRGIDVHSREENLMRVFTVAQVMRREVPTLRDAAPFAEVVRHFLVSELPVCFVVDHNGHLLGEISIHDVKTMLQEDALGPLVIAKDLTQNPEATVNPDETLARCLEKFAVIEQEYLPVVSPAMQLQGVISQRDILNLYNREMLRHEYLGLSLRAERLTSSVHERVRLPHEYVVEVVRVPGLYAGKTLRETQLRTQFALTAVAIRRGGFNGQDELPDPDRPLVRQDYLVLVGRPADVRRFAAEGEDGDRAVES